jgi:hypothetical protein
MGVRSVKVPAVLQTKEGQWAVLGIVGVLVVYYIARKVLPQVGGLVSGNNAITQNQTDASGQPVTAYQGAGVAGTLGAAFNSASGGVLASIGEWIGGKLADLTLPDGSSTQATNRDQVVTQNFLPDVSDVLPGAAQTWN